MRYLSNWPGVSETMILTLTVWLCSLVVVGLFVTPFFGVRLAGTLALGLLIVLLALCWSLCVYRRPHPPARQQPLNGTSKNGASSSEREWVLIK